MANRARAGNFPIWPAALTGAYASLIAIWPAPSGKLLLALPLILAPLVWWMLAGPVNWLAIFFFAALLLPPLPFALGDSGPHPGLAVAALGLAAGGLRFDEWRIHLDSLSRRILFFAVLLLASVPLALLYSGPTIATGSLARVALFCISVYVFFYSRCGPGAGAVDDFRALRFLFLAGAASALFACLDFYFQFPPPAGYGPQFIWLASGIYRRAQGVFYDAGALGNLCAFFLVMIAAALLQPRARRPMSSPLMLAGGLVFSAALLLSFSRSSLVNVAVAVCALLYLHRQRIRWRTLLAAGALAFAVAVLATFAVLPVFAQLYWTRVFNSFRYFVESPNSILSGRLDSWSYLFHFLSNHPLYALFGVGYKTLPYSRFLGKTVIADNSYLSLFVETGVVGLAAMLALSLAILQASRRAARSSGSAASFFGTWMFCFWCGEMAQMMSGDILTYWRVLPLYFWVLARAVRDR